MISGRGDDDWSGDDVSEWRVVCAERFYLLCSQQMRIWSQTHEHPPYLDLPFSINLKVHSTSTRCFFARSFMGIWELWGVEDVVWVIGSGRTSNYKWATPLTYQTISWYSLCRLILIASLHIRGVYGNLLRCLIFPIFLDVHVSLEVPYSFWLSLYLSNILASLIFHCVF